MPFTNRIRLPFKLTRPQYEEDRDDYRKANGVTVTLNVIIRKVYEGITDYFPDKWHERLKIALAHDNVTIEGDKYVGGVTQTSDYTIDWIEFLDYPFAPAKFKAHVTPFNASNSNCGSCEEFTQVVCEDDDAGTLEEDTTYTIDILANDSICCNPVTISLVTFNTTYLDSCIVNGSNQLVIHTKTGLADINSVVLATYRAQCDNGLYDEANVIGNIDGSLPSCLAPINTTNLSVTDVTATFGWDAPSPAPSCGYIWEVRLYPSNVFVSTGTTGSTTVIVTGLTASTDYSFHVKSDCCAGSLSNFGATIIFTTNPESGSEACGEYTLHNTSFVAQSVTYIDCNGNDQTVALGPFRTTSICALQTSPGSPVEISPESSGVTVTYVDLC